MDLEAVLLGVRERDKWRRRLETLEQSLRDVREERKKLQLRLRKIKRDISRLLTVSDALADQRRTLPVGGRIHAPYEAVPNLPAR